MCALKALCSLQKKASPSGVMTVTLRDTGENFGTSAAQESVTPSGLGAFITAEKKHGKLGKEADHPQVLCLTMCIYEIIILLEMSHHFILQAPPVSVFNAGLQSPLQDYDNYVIQWNTK